jgi:hypothetical protein
MSQGPYCKKCGHGAGTHGMTYCNWTFGITGLPEGNGAPRTCDCTGYSDTSPESTENGGEA